MQLPTSPCLTRLIELSVAIEGRDFSGILDEYAFAKHDDEIVIDLTLVGSAYTEERQFTLGVTKASNLQLGSSITKPLTRLSKLL